MRLFLFNALAVCMLLPAVIFAEEFTVTVSIPPQKYIVDEISGSKIKVNILVSKGADPHTFSPKTSQAVLMSKSTLYLGIGFPFENSVLPQLVKSYKNLKIVDTAKGVEQFTEESGFINMYGEEHEGHGHDELDPHVWMSPRSMLLIAENTYNALMAADPSNAETYTVNYTVLRNRIQELDRKFEEVFITGKVTKKFLIYHPYLGYFARDYGLEQYAVENDGKPPKAKDLQNILIIARESKIKLFFTNPQQSSKSAGKIASELGVKVVSIDILAENWVNMIEQLYGAFAATEEQ